MDRAPDLTGLHARLVDLLWDLGPGTLVDLSAGAERKNNETTGKRDATSWIGGPSSCRTSGCFGIDSMENRPAECGEPITLAQFGVTVKLARRFLPPCS
jgi:hypothetical protein